MLWILLAIVWATMINLKEYSQEYEYGYKIKSVLEGIFFGAIIGAIIFGAVSLMATFVFSLSDTAYDALYEPEFKYEECIYAFDDESDNYLVASENRSGGLIKYIVDTEEGRQIKSVLDKNAFITNGETAIAKHYSHEAKNRFLKHVFATVEHRPYIVFEIPEGSEITNIVEIN